MKNILESSHADARNFFLKEKSYFSLELPKYYIFQNLINKISDKFINKQLSDFYSKTEVNTKLKPDSPRNYDDVNYKFLSSKDGKYAWRPFQIIHPVLYVSLVHTITKEENWEYIVNRFSTLSNNTLIKCYSIPVVSENELSDKAAAVSNWWHSIEQKSIELALEYQYVLHTDITDCYGSIYTHSVVWALHTKEIAKENKDNKALIGNKIDKHLQDMSFGQTNGIPQGSVLMDFIAEIVLAYADSELSLRILGLNLTDYQIIRYRDDYRVFTNNPQTAELIIKQLTEILIELGMRLNAQKTFVSENLVQDSIKPDKIAWLTNYKNNNDLQKHLLFIHNFSQDYPNSGSLVKALDKFYNKLSKTKKYKHNIIVLISIIVDIAYNNPKSYPISAAILSKLLVLIENCDDRDRIINSIKMRFHKIPNTGHLQVWLQRITLKIDREAAFDEILCKKVYDQSIILWNSSWLNTELQTIISNEPIIDEESINELNDVIGAQEVQLFFTIDNYN